MWAQEEEENHNQIEKLADIILVRIVKRSIFIILFIWVINYWTVGIQVNAQCTHMILSQKHGHFGMIML